MNDLIDKQNTIKIIKNADVFVAYHEKDPIEEAVDRAIRATKRSIIYDIENLSSTEAIENEVTEFWKTIKDMDADSLDKIFGEMNFWAILNSMPYSEAKAKYNEWKKQKDKIHVGDEVIYHCNKYVVGYVGADEVYHIVDQNWIRVVVQGDYQIFKTGRHFPEVAELLKKMKVEDVSI